MMHRAVGKIVVCLVLWHCAACATVPVVPSTPALGDGIYRVADGASLTEAEFARELVRTSGEGALVVYVGETHDNEVHHAIQTEIYTLFARRFPGRSALGMEMFPASMQPVLNAYRNREIDDDTLLVRTQWQENWGFDFALYAPMLQLAQSQGADIVCLNAPRGLTRKLAREGVEGLSEAEREGLPPTFGLDNPAHRERIRDVLSAVHEMDDASFARFYAAQVGWDATMAWSLHQYLEETSEVKVIVVLAGGYHVYGGLGIPWHLAQTRGEGLRSVVVVPVDGASTKVTAEDLVYENTGDYVWISGSPTDESRL